MSFSSLALEASQPILLAWAIGTVVLAYAIFSLVGFGSALLASTPLANVMPVASVVPLLALLDFAGSLWRGWRARHELDTGELLRLVPAMLLGQVIGVLVLSALPAAVMAVLLGVFVIVYGARGLSRPEKRRSIKHYPHAGFVVGVTGGVFGGLFGSGGFIYASYLENKLPSRAALRATQAALIALSTGGRIVLCGLAGLIDQKLLITAIVLMPAAMFGAWLGLCIDIHLSRQRLLFLINLLLVASGLGLIFRFAG